MAIGTYISIITLNINGLNAPTKRHRLAEWIQKQDPYIRCLQETHFKPQDTYRLKVRGWKNIFHANGKQKKTGIAIFITNKIGLKIKNITKAKEGHYIVIKGYEDCYSSFPLPPVCMEYIFPSSHFQSICVFRSDVGFL